MYKACLLLLWAAAVAAAPVPVRAASLGDQLFIGTEALTRGRFELAAQSFATALAADPDNPYARTRLGLALYGTGQTDRARAELEKALSARADDLFALWTLGCLDLLAGQPAAAAGRFAAMSKADPGNVRSLLGLGLAALDEGRTTEGVGFLAKVQQADSGDALVRFLTGYAYWLLDAPANARLELEGALELEPRNTAALELLGLVYRRQGQANLAASAWGQALAIDPKAAGARFFLSRLAEDEGLAATLADRPAEAKRAYERALAVDPGNAAAAKALGLAVPQPIAPPGSPKGASPHAARPTGEEAPARPPLAKEPGSPPAKAEGKGKKAKAKEAGAPPAGAPATPSGPAPAGEAATPR